MENNLLELAKRFSEIKSELLHGGYAGDLLENHITDVLTEELLSNLGEIGQHDNVKRAMVNMFFLGQIMK